MGIARQNQVQVGAPENSVTADKRKRSAALSMSDQNTRLCSATEKRTLSVTEENTQRSSAPCKKRPKKPVYVTIPLGLGLWGLMDLHTHEVYGTAYSTQVEAREAADRLGDPHVTVTETWR